MNMFTSQKPWLLSALTICFLISASSDAAISVGGRAACSDYNVNVRSTAGGTTVVGQQQNGVQGTVIGGPTIASVNGTSYTWWQVNFDTGVDGWIASIFLVEISSIPSAPSSLAAVAGVGSVSLGWNDTSSIETGFRIERKTGSGGSWAEIYTTGANAQSYSDFSVAGSTQYFYRIRAFNGSGNSGYSNEANVTTPTTVTLPQAPGPMGFNNLSTNQVTVNWLDNSNNETGFRLERKTGVAGAWGEIATLGANVTSQTDTGLTAGTPYYYRVRAYNSAGNSSYSSEIQVTTTTPQVPTAPSNLSAAVSTTTVTLSWSDLSLTETGFRIERKTGSGGSWAEINTTAANTSTYQDLSLNGGSTYFYRVRAYNAAGNSSYTNEASATPVAPQPAPTVTTVSPSSVIGSTSERTFTISGSNFVSGAKVQVAYVSNGYSFVDTNVNATFVNTTTLTVPIVTSTTVDTWRVRVRNPDGQTSSGYVTFDVTSAPAPSVTSVTPGSVTGSSSPQTFTVSGANFASGAKVQVAFASNGYSFIDTSTNATFVSATTLTVPIVTQTAADTWRVRVRNPDGQTSTGYVTFTVNAPVVAVPTVTGISPGSVTGSSSAQTFTITGTNFVSGAKVQVAYASNGYSFVDTSVNATFVNSTTLTVPIVTSTTVDTWRVRVRNPDGQISSGYVTFNVTAAPVTAPSVTGVSPGSVTGSSSPQSFTVTGSNFVSGAKVQVAFASNGYSFIDTSTNATFVSATTLTVPIVTQTAADTWRVRVRNPDGQTSTGYVTFTVNAPVVAVPTVTGISPGSVTGSSSAQTFTITGTNFVSGAKVQVAYASNGYSFVDTSVNATFVNSTTLTVPIVTSTTVDTWRVRVCNPDGQSSAGYVTFDVTSAPQLAPTVTGVSPGSVTGSSSPQSFTVTGSNFVSGAKVQVAFASNGYSFIDTSTIATFVSATTLTVPIVTQTAADTWRVRVRNPDGQTSTGFVTFTVNAPAGAVPTVTGVSPGSVTGSSSPQSFTITGTNFVSGAKVQVAFASNGYSFIDTSTNATFVSSTTLTVPIVTQTMADTWRVRVRNPDGQTSSGYVTFTVNAPVGAVPTVTSITPGSVTGSSSPQTFTITGTNFVLGTKVQVAFATNGYSFVDTSVNAVVVSSTTLTVPIVTQSMADTWRVRVRTPDGQTSSGYITFTVGTPTVSPPVLAGIDPPAVVGSSTARTFTLSGSGFVSGARVQVAYVSNGYTFTDTLTAAKWVNSGTLTVPIVTLTTADTWKVRVRNPDGQLSGEVSLSVTVQTGPPAITLVSPNPVTGVPLPDRTDLQLFGTDFQPGCQVFFTWGGQSTPLVLASEHITRVSANQLNLRVRTGTEPDAWNVHVKNPDAKTSNVVSFQVVAPTGLVSLASVSPSSVPPSENLRTFTLNGSGFGTSDSVKLTYGTRTVWLTAPNVQFHSAGQLTFSQTFQTAPMNANVRVVKSNGTETSPQTITVSTSLMPDLVCNPASITFSPSAVAAGDIIQIRCVVRNLGSAAAGASFSRFRLSQDKVLESQDLPFDPLDVPVPSIPAGGSHTIETTLRVPLTTTPGVYYCGVFADARLQASQSNTTNDDALSASQLQVTIGTPSALSFEIQPQDLAVKEWATINLKAKAKSAIRYQWFFNGLPVAYKTTQYADGTTTLKIQLSTASHSGTYKVIATGANGQVLESRTALVSVNAPAKEVWDALDKRRVSLYSFSDLSVNRNAPTILITHGWQAGGEWTNKSTEGFRDLAAKLRDRLSLSGVGEANILLFTWEGAYRVNPFEASSNITYAGSELAKLISQTLGVAYSKPIHFIGHSFGCFVNATALNTLQATGALPNMPIAKSDKIVLVTNLDPAFRGTTWDSTDYTRLLSNVQFIGAVENYYANHPLPLIATGQPIPGAGPVPGGQVVINWLNPFSNLGRYSNNTPIHHSTVWEGWYASSVTKDQYFHGNQVCGFGNSVLLDQKTGWHSLKRNFPWPPNDAPNEKLINSTTPAFIIPKFNDATSDTFSVNGSGFNLWSFGGSQTNSTDSLSGALLPTKDLALPKRTSARYSFKSETNILGNTLGLKEPEPHQMVLRTALTLPITASALRISAKRVSAGETQGLMSIMFAGQPLQTVGLDYFNQDEFTTLDVPIQPFRNRSGLLEIWLQNDDLAEAILRFGRIEVVSDSSVSAAATSLSVTSPKNKLRVLSSRLICTGSWKSPVPLQEATAALNDESPVPLSIDSKGQWNIEMGVLRPGLNRLRFDARTIYGQIVSITREVHRVVTTELTTIVDGMGTIKGANLGTKLVEIGQTIALTAVPKSGHVFDQWSGDLEGTSPLTSLFIQGSSIIMAHFVPSPFIGREGAYTAALTSTDFEWTGWTQIVITASGSFSGVVQVGSRKISISGLLNSSGTALLYLGEVGASLNIQIDITSPTATATMILRRGGVDVAISLGMRPGYNGSASIYPRAGKFTMVFDRSGEVNMPFVYGYGTLTVSTKGKIAFSGVLPDRSTVTQSADIQSDGAWPFYALTHKGKGWIGGEIYLGDGETTRDMEGIVTWSKPATTGTFQPAAWLGQLGVIGSRYTPPPSQVMILPGMDAANNQLYLSWGNGLYTNTTFSEYAEGLLDTSNRTSFSRAGTKVTFNTSTGVFTGTVPDPRTGKNLPHAGVILQAQQIGFGMFWDSILTADVTLFGLNRDGSVAIDAAVVPAGSGTVSGVGNIPLASPAMLVATPAPGYTFVRWREGTSEVSANSSYTFIAKRTRTLTAEFRALLPAGAIRFSDDFNDNVIDTAKWTAVGNTPVEANQQMELRQAVTDSGPTVTTTAFPVNATGKIIIRRRTFVHYAGSNTRMRMNIVIGTLPRFCISYANDYWEIPRYGFYVVRNNANEGVAAYNGDVAEAVSPIWDTWFNERLEYNPVTGDFDYFINEELKRSYNVGILPASTSPAMQISFHSWGWNTGQQHFFDDLEVSQE